MSDLAEGLARTIDQEIRTLDHPKIDSIRAVRKRWSATLSGHDPADIVGIALALRDRQRWVGYELIHEHPGGLTALDVATVERLGQGMAAWDEVDPFGRYVSGQAWRIGRIADADVHRWALSPDRWWRRAALVSTVPLNLRAAGGTGDTVRTLAVCRMLVGDPDDMVVKALSWALRTLVVWDGEAVRAFAASHDEVIAARVRREVATKLTTGRKI